MKFSRKNWLKPRRRYALAVPALLISGLALAAPANAATGRAIARPASPAVRDCGTGPALVRPGSLILTCADDGELAGHLAWSSWTPARATASGVVTWRVCTPNCAESTKWESTGANFTLTGPESAKGHRVLFTRVQLEVTGRTPRGFMRDIVFSMTPATAGPPQLDKRSVKLPPPAPSGSLGYGQIEGYWIIAGGPSGSAGSYTYPQIAAAITGAESSFLPGNIQQGVDYCGGGADRAGWGLWQITCGNSVPQYGTDFQILDPWNNAEEAVYKYDQAGGFSPWSTYTSGAYTAYLQNTPPDTNISDPGEYVQYSSTPPGTPSSPPPDPGSTYGPPMPGHSSYLAGGPVIFDQASGNLEVYAVGTDGALWERAYVPGKGWAAWSDLGGSISGRPSVIYNPANGHLEVYARGANGPLFQKYWSPSTGWSAWIDLGGSITGSPTAIYDQATGNVEVYSTDSSGALEQIAWIPGKGWTGWLNLGGSISGNPSPVYNPANGHIEVYVRGANGPLFQKYWSSSGGWSAWIDLGGSITGSPAALYDPASGNLEVYATESGGSMGEIAWIPAKGWTGWSDLGGSVAGSPSPVYNPGSGHLEAYMTGANGPLFQKYWSPSGGWSAWNDLGGSITGSPAALYDPSGSDLEVYGVTSGTNALWEAYWVPSTGWHTTSLGGSLDGF